MKLSKLSVVLMVPVIAVFAGACSKSDSGSKTASCMAASISLTQTNVSDYPSANTVFVNFDAKNTSGANYDIASGSPEVMIDMIVTTTDGSKYETKTSIGTASIAAGATASTLVEANYGAGKTYKSYTYTLICQ